MSQSSSNLPAPTGGDFILYTAPDGPMKVDVFFKDETVYVLRFWHAARGEPEIKK